METYFILNDDGESVEMPNLRQYLYAMHALMRDGKHIIKETEIPMGSTSIQVSTIFYGLGPCPFETLVLGGPDNGEQAFSATRAAAEATHDEIVDLYRLRGEH